MKTLKFFSIVLGLIILISFFACKDIKNPYTSNIPDPNNPTDGITEITVDYTGSQVVATLGRFRITLNSVETPEKLRNLGYYPEVVWVYPDKGKFVLVELKIKNIGTDLTIAATTRQFTLFAGGCAYLPDESAMSSCLRNGLWVEMPSPGEETPLKGLLYDVADTTNSTLIFIDHPDRPTLCIRFNLLTL